MASAGGRLRPGRGRNILFLYSLPHGPRPRVTCHVSLCVWSPLWLADAGHVTGCGSAIGWGSHDLLPDPGLAQPVSHVRGEAAVGQTLLGLGISHLTSWLKFLDTIELQMNVSEDFTITEKAPSKPLPALRIYAIQIARPLWHLCWHPNFTSTYHGLSKHSIA